MLKRLGGSTTQTLTQENKKTRTKRTAQKKKKKFSFKTMSRIVTAALGAGILFMSDNISAFGFWNTAIAGILVLLLSNLSGWLFYGVSDPELLIIENENNINNLELAEFGENATLRDDGDSSRRSAEYIDAPESELTMKSLVSRSGGRYLGYFTTAINSLSNSLTSLYFLHTLTNTWVELICYAFNIRTDIPLSFLSFPFTSRGALTFFTSIGSFGLLFAILKLKSRRLETFFSYAGVVLLVVLVVFLGCFNFYNGLGNSFATFASIPSIFEVSWTRILSSMSILFFAFHKEFRLPYIISNMGNRTRSVFMNSLFAANGFLFFLYKGVGFFGLCILGSSFSGDVLTGFTDPNNALLGSLYTTYPFLRTVAFGMRGLYSIIYLSAAYNNAYEPYQWTTSFRNWEVSLALGLLAGAGFTAMSLADPASSDNILSICGTISLPFIANFIPAFLTARRYHRSNSIGGAVLYYIYSLLSLGFEGLLAYVTFFGVEPSNYVLSNTPGNVNITDVTGMIPE